MARPQVRPARGNDVSLQTVDNGAAVRAPVGAAGRIPTFVSVDDHVVEPPHLWQRWMPAKYRDRAPRVVQAGYEVRPGRLGLDSYAMTESGPVVDWWLYEDLAKTMTLVMHWQHGKHRENLHYRPTSFAEMPESF